MKQRFKTIGGVVALSAMIVMSVSCAKEDLSENAQNQITGVKRYISVSANLPTMGGEDKAYMDPTDDNNVKWEIGDEININGTVLSVTGTANSNTTAYFDGTVYAIPDGRDELYWAVYPSNLMPVTNSSTIPDKFGKGEIYFSYPRTQTYDATQNPLQNCAYMAGFARVPQGTSNFRFEMKNLGAVLRINLQPKAGETNTKVSKLVFSSNKTLVGKCRIDNGEWGLAPQGESDDYTLVVNLTDGTHNYIDIAGGATVYVLLCAPNGAQMDLTMTVYNTDDKYAQKTSKNLELHRNSIYTSNINNISFDKTDYLFSVSADKKVFFSPGNLQYQARGSYLDGHSNNLIGGTWRFAPNQWDFIGNAPGNTTADANRSTQSDWIDLFGWGTSGWNSGAAEYLPYSTSVTNTDYHPGRLDNVNLTGTYARADWGVYNAIYNPKTGSTDPKGTWRTLTKDEWVYLIDNRKVNVGGTPKEMYGRAFVNGVRGMVLLPDNWDPASCPGFVYGNSTESNFDESTSPKWSQMEALGCVFLPIADSRNGTTIYGSGSYTWYWSSTCIDGDYAYCTFMDWGDFFGDDSNDRRKGLCVRLVKDAY